MLKELNLVFQGGGARLAALIAAAEAAYTGKSRLGYKITKVSGTSAGAIAACILATGENPAIFKERLAAIAETALSDICPESTIIAKLFSIKMGWPIYNTIKYRDFLSKLFHLDHKQWVYLDDLPIDIFIHAVDIRTKDKVIYRKGSEPRTTLVDALFASSALPFIFHTYRDRTGLTDGGLLNNFPVEILLNDSSSYVAGFSFENSKNEFSISNLKEFCMALLSTVMDYTTNSSLSKMPTPDVHYLKTETTTLDFKKAISTDLKGSEYSNYYKSSSAFLSDFMARKRTERLAISSDSLVKRMISLHNTLSESQDTITRSLTIVFKSNSLRLLDLSNPNSIDEFQMTFEIEPHEKATYTHGFFVLLDDEIYFPGDVKPIVTDQSGQKVGVSVFPLSATMFERKGPKTNVILFFINP